MSVLNMPARIVVLTWVIFLRTDLVKNRKKLLNSRFCVWKETVNQLTYEFISVPPSPLTMVPEAFSIPLNLSVSCFDTILLCDGQTDGAYSI